MAKTNANDWKNIIHSQFNRLHINALSTNLINDRELYNALVNHHQKSNGGSASVTSRTDELDAYHNLFMISTIIILCIAIGTALTRNVIEQTIGIRCFVPNNYLIWEATRPISDCSFCIGVTKPHILPNVSREEFTVRVNVNHLVL